MSKCTFEVGDRVRIKDFDEMIEEFGTQDDGTPDVFCGFNPQMKRLCGLEATISDIRGYTVSFEERIEYGRGGDENRAWNISFDMISHIEDEPTPEIDFNLLFGS